jgi:hypothetical protein
MKKINLFPWLCPGVTNSTIILSRDSSVDMTSRPPAGFPVKLNDFTLLHNIQTGFGAHPMATGGSSPRGKEAKP